MASLRAPGTAMTPSARLTAACLRAAPSVCALRMTAQVVPPPRMVVVAAGAMTTRMVPGAATLTAGGKAATTGTGRVATLTTGALTPAAPTTAGPAATVTATATTAHVAPRMRAGAALTQGTAGSHPGRLRRARTRGTAATAIATTAGLALPPRTTVGQRATAAAMETPGAAMQTRAAAATPIVMRVAATAAATSGAGALTTGTRGAGTAATGLAQLHVVLTQGMVLRAVRLVAGGDEPVCELLGTESVAAELRDMVGGWVCGRVKKKVETRLRKIDFLVCPGCVSAARVVPA
mmetsp:Transcript_5160/g.12698  ORF Transcript_5160/g.12698 Transcript_5160/m.12698 type:complete len:293 (-) Transcript_5160:374-1252(-)